MAKKKKKRTIGRRIIRLVLIVAGVAVLAVGGLLVAALITDYRPEAIIALETKGSPKDDNIEAGREYSITTFNIGYCGLGRQQDFFMDGGQNAGAGSEEEVLDNLANIERFVTDTGSDFIMLQEVDEQAKRSFGINQKERFEALKGYQTSFAYNYKVMYVPIPLLRPMGGVKGGIMTLACAPAVDTTRHVFNGSEPFPVQLFELDRCFTISRYDTDSGGQFVLINAHFSAYDKGGAVRAQQLEQMKQVAADEYAKGNYVVIGGDWNNELPGTDANNFEWKGAYPDWYMKLPDDFAIEGYSWAVDPATPTCRDNRTQYKKDETFVVTLDGFLVSDNVDVTSVQAIDLGFVHSDHNPVNMKFILK